MKHLTSAILLILILLSFTGAFAIPQENCFPLFTANVSGRYELIPAFGRLFAAVGRYMNGTSLYSYYGAEIIPLCPAPSETCPYDHSPNSFHAYIRFYSNMSYAGTYWPGETIQRLTLVPGGLMIRDHAGDGDGLVSRENTMMIRSEKAPSTFIYGPAEAGSMFGNGSAAAVPEALTGAWQLSRPEVRFSVGSDGTMVMLKELGTDLPPMLLKGGVSVSDAEDGSYELCYMLSSTHGGTMPYMGCAVLKPDGRSLAAAPSPSWDDRLILPENGGTVKYERYVP